MADALCGPSNALSSFQKHAQVDRTLQQDRHTGPRHSPAQGFRSFDPRAGSLDAEFHAFENAPTNPFQLQQPAWQQNAGPASQSQPALGWANDFQNLRISNAPIPVSQFRTEAPLIKTTPGGWQQEFMMQRQNATPISQQKQPAFAPQAEQPSYTPFLGSSGYMPQQGLPAQIGASAQTQAHEPQFNEADFETAFNNAYIDMMKSAIETSSGTMLDAGQSQSYLDMMKSAFGTSSGMMQDAGHDQALGEEDVLQSDIHQPSDTKIGSDAIDYTEMKDRGPDQDTRDAGALARVAGQLVQNVSHEQDEKFKNSQFLDLMRKIRDREVEVRNNDFESTEELRSASHPEPYQPPPQDQHSFQFPNMNNVYHPDQMIDGIVDEDIAYQPAVPQSQISDLHPGGPLYPEQSPPQPQYAHMSGAVDFLSTDDASSKYASA